MILLALFACQRASDVQLPDTDTDVVDEGMPIEVSEHAGTSGVDRSGLVAIPVDVKAGQTAFMVVGTSEKYLSVEEVTDPEGEVVLSWRDWNGLYSLTEAFYPWFTDVSFNWPVREVDGPLAEGTWTVWLATTNYNGSYVSDVDVETRTRLKTDPDLQAGEVRVRIVLADGVDDDDEVVTAVEAAVEVWREIWAAKGLVLVERYESGGIDADLQAPYDNEQLADLSEGNDGRELLLVIGETLYEQGLYGEAGGIPGSLEPGHHSGVFVSWLACAGFDASFDEDEIGLFGETMAHEIGHYQGLFHPVEWDYDYWDALDDTPECSSAISCEDKMADNLMFPYPICSFTACDPQRELTAQQRAVVHHHIGTL